MYSDEKRKAVTTDYAQGDLFHVKQNRENKLSTNFHPNPMKIMEKNGNSVVIQSDQGVKYKRNVTHVKKVQSK